MSACKYCGEPITWATHPNSGKLAPFDAASINSAWTLETSGDHVLAKWVQVYRPHHASCTKYPGAQKR